MKLTDYIGIADAHGIESFKKKKEADDHFLGCLSIRAQTNRQRHAVVYTAKLTEAVEQEVEAQIKKGDFVGALDTLKGCAVSLKCESGWEKSFEMIPNPHLDPWYKVEEEDDE